MADISVKTKNRYLHLTAALMELFVKGIAPVKHFYINPN